MDTYATCSFVVGKWTNSRLVGWGSFFHFSSSSPLLSLVQAKLAINLSIHTQHTYDNGVDRTGRQGIKKNTALVGKWTNSRFVGWGRDHVVVNSFQGVILSI